MNLMEAKEIENEINNKKSFENKLAKIKLKKEFSKAFIFTIFQEDFVNLNIGGFKFKVKWLLLETRPQNRLGKIRFAQSFEEVEQLCDEINFEENELYFDKTAEHFDAILTYYRTGELHFDEGTCYKSFHNDLVYWQIEHHLINDCCLLNFGDHKTDIEMKYKHIKNIEDKLKKKKMEFTKIQNDILLKKIRDILENKNNTTIGKVK